MKRWITLSAWAMGIIMTVILLSACTAQPGPVLPTATFAPTDVVPSVTATYLPPPTVTFFPSATPRSGDVLIVTPSDQSGSLIPGTPSVPVSSGAPLDTATTVDTATPADTPTPSSTPTPAPTDTPSPTPTPLVQNLPGGATIGDKIYTASFDQGWPSVADPSAHMGIVNGQYAWQIGPFDARFITTTLVNQNNLYEEIQATPAKCPDKAGYGLIARYKDASDYYVFSLFCDNTYTVVAKVGGSVFGLSNGKLPDGIDDTTNQPHRVGIAAFKDSFSLYFDGQVIGSFSDNQLAQGDVALYAFSQGTSPVQVSFDNWQVWSLR